MNAAILLVSTFGVAFALGLQSLNVNGGQRLLATLTSFAMGGGLRAVGVGGVQLTAGAPILADADGIVEVPADAASRLLHIGYELALDPKPTGKAAA